MITVENLSYSFPQKDLYNKISFTLEDGQHCAFIGSNGTGKSTLIDLIMYPEKHLFDGKLEISPNCRIGYVSQFLGLDKSKDITVFEYIAEEFINLQNEMTSLGIQMESSSDIEALLEKYQKALDSFEAIGGNDFESNITKKLNLANLNRHENLMISQLSGGEFKLVQVIKSMLISPDLLIMDEPDAFLDFKRLNALKDLINSHKGMLLVITHNRYLLNHCFNKILHLENTELQEFNGRYIDYNFALLQRKIELQEQVAAEEAEIERNKIIVDKLRFDASYYTCATRGRALHARVSHLERLEARKIKEPFVDIKQPQFNFITDNVVEETIALKVENYSVSFDEILLEHVSFEIKSSDKVALIGPNGSGKTTILRDIYNNHHDSIEIREGIKVAFLSQLQGEMLNESNSIQEEFLESGFQTYEDIKSHIINYGFEEEALHQKISALSGGEKNLLQLAKIAANHVDLLLLDEPTSHLDTYSQIALEAAIANYNGAILMVSHDFYTIANCVDYVLLIEEKSIRRMSARNFRKMIYANHFNKDYLENEQKKKEIETKIALAIQDKNFELAKNLSEKLEVLIEML